MIKPGKETTEHARSFRAEGLGIALVLFGAWLSFSAQWAGVAFAGLGALLVGLTQASYASARGNVKAAAVRRPVDQAPRHI